jgi:hypothetical protein
MYQKFRRKPSASRTGSSGHGTKLTASIGLIETVDTNMEVYVGNITIIL